VCLVTFTEWKCIDGVDFRVDEHEPIIECATARNGIRAAD
jgi:hypothetical protein